MLLLGLACFVCKNNIIRGDSNHKIDVDMCLMCCTTKVKLSSLTGPALIAHNPYGFCLSINGICTIQLKTTAKHTTIDMKYFRCSNLQKNLLKTTLTFIFAKKMTAQSSTNHLLAFLLCPLKSNAMWKYNLWLHIICKHSTTNVEFYQSLFAITDNEQTLMKAIYMMVLRMSALAKNNMWPALLQISEGHFTQMVLMWVAINIYLFKSVIN